jgi:hypothetical protein
MAPNTPQGGLAQAIAELKDAKHLLTQLRALKEQARKAARNAHQLKRSAGQSYLAGQFGIAPMIKDLIDIYSNTKKLSKRVRQLDRDSGRVVRRRVTLVDETQTAKSTSGTGGHPILVSQFYTNVLGNTAETNTTTTTKVWCSAAFTYYLPPSGQGYFSDVARHAALTRICYGYGIDVSLFWELVPWSWLGDWIGNIGDIARNWSNLTSDNLVLHYAFVMAETRKESVTTRTITLRGNGPLYPSRTSISYCKQRAIASPFGFGIAEENFSPRQIAILAALGAQK